MKSWKEMRPIVRRAVEVTGGRAEFKDRRAPVWDGKGWHFARIRSEMHVVHEVAHWLANPLGRPFPNYSLGKDPDGGPVTTYDGMDIMFPWLRRFLAEEKVGTEDAVALIQRELSWEEEITSVLSIRMLYLFGFSGWLGEAKRIHLLEPAYHWKTFQIVDLLAERGVDFLDPLPQVFGRPAPPPWAPKSNAADGYGRALKNFLMGGAVSA